MGFLLFFMTNPLFFWSVSLVCNLWGAAEVLYSMKGSKTESCIDLSVKLEVNLFFFVFLPFEHCQSGYFASDLTWKKSYTNVTFSFGSFFFTIVWKNPVLPWHLFIRNWSLCCLREASLSSLSRQENLLIVNSSCSSLAKRDSSVEDKCWCEAWKLRLLQKRNAGVSVLISWTKISALL